MPASQVFLSVADNLQSGLRAAEETTDAPRQVGTLGRKTLSVKEIANICHETKNSIGNLLAKAPSHQHPASSEAC